MALRTLTWDEPVRVTDVIKMEHPTYSRDLVTIASGAGVLEIGTVLGKVTASGKYDAHADGASDGTETAVAVLVERVDATSADQPAVVVARFAEVSRLGLRWDASVNTEGKKDAAIAELRAVGIITREGA
jgi:hypothetical protein